MFFKGVLLLLSIAFSSCNGARVLSQSNFAPEILDIVNERSGYAIPPSVLPPVYASSYSSLLLPLYSPFPSPFPSPQTRVDKEKEKIIRLSIGIAVGVGGGIILVLLGVIGFLLHKLKKAKQSWNTID